MLERFSQVIPGINWQGADSTVNPVEAAVNIMLQLAAALSVIYIIIAAIRLTTSGGDPGAIATGRKTIIFAIVGLIISVMGMTLTAIVQSRASEVAGSGNPWEVVRVVVDMLRFAVGAASVIMLVVGGIRFATSGGDPQAARAARNTVLYAFVGIIVAFAAALMVSLVLNRIGS